MDYSFLRLSKTMAEANQLKDSPLAVIRYTEVIQLLPTEHYLQISNTDFGISFDGDYQAVLVDCNDKQLAEITDNVAIYEFIDRNGINQIAFELYKLNVDFYKNPVHLKLIHTLSNDVYYSNSFYVTEYEKEKTSRFDYFNHNYFQGISYDKVSFYQSIRLQLWFDNLEDKTEVSDYYQISNGNTISTRPLYKQSEIYKCEMISNFSFERSNILLLHDIIYIDGVRMTNKTTLKSGARIGSTNFFKTEFSCFKNYNDNYLAYPFIYEPLYLVSKSPFGVYTISNLPNEIIGNFNKNIYLGSGKITIYEISTFPEYIAEFTNPIITGNSFEIDITGIITINGRYLVTIESGLFTSGLDTFNGTSWEFIVQNPDYSNTDYSNVDYLTN